MNKTLLKKMGVVILIMVVLRISLIACLNYINIHSSHYIYAQNHEIALHDPLKDHLYTIVNGGENNEENKVLYIRSDKKQEFSLFIENLTFLHKIYINDKLVSQNINKSDNFYDNDYAYKVFKINNSHYINDTIKIRIEGNHADKTDLFLARDDIAEYSHEIITIIYIMLLVLLLVNTVISLMLYYYTKEYYFLILSILGVTSIIKSLVIGRLIIVCRLLDITVQYYNLLNNLTSIVNTILPLVIMCHLFDFKLKRKYVIMGLCAYFLLGFFILKDGGNLSLYSIMLLCAVSVGNIVMFLAFMKDKPYSKVIMINGVIYSSLTFYYISVLKRTFPNGNLVFLISPGYLGVVIYMSIILIAILLHYVDKQRLLESERKEYERVQLLRGICHDLKLPLSVIKLNNQMIEKYDLSSEDIKEYAATSLEATLELEKMTENINSFLSLKKLQRVGQTTSVKECFEKLKHYFNSLNRYGNCRLIVECDDKDCKLDINPLYFSRMLYNLVDNAFKYNKDEVQVTAKYKIDKKLVISIEDNGLGMEQSEKERVFEPFYQIDKSRNMSGLGLGLSIVKGIVDSLSGTIDVESKEGVGTKITIIFSQFK